MVERLSKLDSISIKSVLQEASSSDNSFTSVLLQIKSILNEANVVINRDSKLDISHHFGISRFREFGCCMFTCINREYAKKIIIMLPRQKHPLHYHKKKTESFQLLWGDLEIEVDGTRRTLQVGDITTVEVGQWHKFHSLNGACIEEISSHHFQDDSFYEDPEINSPFPELRKTSIESWDKKLDSIVDFL